MFIFRSRPHIKCVRSPWRMHAGAWNGWESTPEIIRKHSVALRGGMLCCYKRDLRQLMSFEVDRPPTTKSPVESGDVNWGEIAMRAVIGKETGITARLDPIDRKILTALQENARIANVDLAEKINLSPSPCLARVKALEEDGFIRRYVTLLNPQAIGLGVNIFIQVR